MKTGRGCRALGSLGLGVLLWGCNSRPAATGPVPSTQTELSGDPISAEGAGDEEVVALPPEDTSPSAPDGEIYEVGPITLDTTCLEYLGFSDDERGAAVRVLGVQAGWGDAAQPFGVLNFDGHCSQRPDQTLRQALGLFAN